VDGAIAAAKADAFRDLARTEIRIPADLGSAPDLS
jgi:hypothetical protein